MKRTQVSRTRDLGKFFTLLGQLPGDIPVDELKEIWASSYTNGRTASLRQMTNFEFNEMMGALEIHVTENNPEWVEKSKARNRVIGVIGAWLRGRNQTANNDKIKAIACRAAKVKTFNKIPLNKLRSLYGEWGNKYAISVEVNAIISERENKLAILN